MREADQLKNDALEVILSGCHQRVLGDVVHVASHVPAAGHGEAPHVLPQALRDCRKEALIQLSIADTLVQVVALVLRVNHG